MLRCMSQRLVLLAAHLAALKRFWTGFNLNPYCNGPARSGKTVRGRYCIVWLRSFAPHLVVTRSFLTSNISLGTGNMRCTRQFAGPCFLLVHSFGQKLFSFFKWIYIFKLLHSCPTSFSLSSLSVSDYHLFYWFSSHPSLLITLYLFCNSVSFQALITNSELSAPVSSLLYSTF